jgi:hypothetical protein
VRFVCPADAFVYDPAPGARWKNDFEVRYQVAGSEAVHSYKGSFEFESDG